MKDAYPSNMWAFKRQSKNGWVYLTGSDSDVYSITCTVFVGFTYKDLQPLEETITTISPTSFSLETK